MSEILVIGSGFGGSIAAKRFTEAGHHVTLLELGESWADPEKLSQSQDPKLVFRLLRDYPADYLRTKPKLRIAAGMGLGGGSLVYAGIHLRAPAHAFERWPSGWTRAHLDPYYARVEQQLGVAPMLDAFAFGRARAFRDGAIAAGLPPPRPLSLAMQGCTRCGWCVPICAFGKKRTMQHTYLADARRTGKLRVVTHRKAAYVARVGGRYRVWAWRTDGVATEYHRVNRGPLEPRDADLVVVAGGAIESPVLLARSVVTLGARPPGVTKSWGRAYTAQLRDYGAHMLSIAVIGKQGAGTERTISVRDDDGNAAISTRAYTPPPGALEAARSIIRALGGQLATTVWEQSGTAITVHPTGGCAMGDDDDAVVRAGDLQVRGNPGLYVIDGSVLPANPLRNPAHTIAAVAERALDVILGVHRADRWPT